MNCFCLRFVLICYSNTVWPLSLLAFRATAHSLAINRHVKTLTMSHMGPTNDGNDTCQRFV